MPKSKKPPDLEIPDDGKYKPEIGSWAEEKYRLLWCYADLFATSMKSKWDKLTYVDLFSGAGYAQIRGSKRVVLGSPLLALTVKNPFDSYVFCDREPNCILALRERVNVMKPKAEVHFVQADANEAVKDILEVLPRYGPDTRVLGFCFADPQKLSDLKFETIAVLAERFMDFLVHIPAMDPMRNEGLYSRPENRAVECFVGNPNWRESWAVTDSRIGFDLFVARCFAESMQSLGYKHADIEEPVLVRSSGKNLPLYYLIFFSRHPLGQEFWKETKKWSDPQLKLFKESK
jgi:three-Cys-motif partner protein